MTRDGANRRRLLAIMSTRGLTVAHVAELVGRAEQTVKMYRSGERAVPDDVIDALETEQARVMRAVEKSA